MSDTIVVNTKSIKEIQAVLILSGVHHSKKELGLEPIPLIGDGEWGQHSRAALQRYQALAKLEATGELDPETLKHFESDDVEFNFPEGNPTLQQIKAMAFLCSQLSHRDTESLILDGEGGDEALRLIANAYVTLIREMKDADLNLE